MSASKEPTLVKVKSSGFTMDLVLKNQQITGLTMDYQKLSNKNDLRELVGILNNLVEGRVPSADLASPLGMLGIGGGPKAQGQQFSQREIRTPAEIETNDCDVVIKEAVDNALNFLGQSGKNTMLSLLENRYGFRPDDIPEHPRAFIELLDETLGSAAYTIEREIISQIRRSAPVKGKSLHAVVHSLRSMDAKQSLPAENIGVEDTAVAIGLPSVAAEEISTPLVAVEEKSAPLEDIPVVAYRFKWGATPAVVPTS